MNSTAKSRLAPFLRETAIIIEAGYKDHFEYIEQSRITLSSFCIVYQSKLKNPARKMSFLYRS
jgi:hypothetical protein